ncbi:hypothetical protein PR048_006081 [Dryococelus australis]|uniref:Uncharacterized protein n=1 Tax=Dryococelus australis TaxID=614101 RepID=A0ABQ9IC60_9NEOP|nr:hypothetical protein PR048_006081 [Dryococelus australis]
MYIMFVCLSSRRFRIAYLNRNLENTESGPTRTKRSGLPSPFVHVARKQKRYHFGSNATNERTSSAESYNLARSRAIRKSLRHAVTNQSQDQFPHPGTVSYTNIKGTATLLHLCTRTYSAAMPDSETAAAPLRRRHVVQRGCGPRRIPTRAGKTSWPIIIREQGLAGSPGVAIQPPHTCQATDELSHASADSATLVAQHTGGLQSLHAFPDVPCFYFDVAPDAWFITAGTDSRNYPFSTISCSPEYAMMDTTPHANAIKSHRKFLPNLTGGNDTEEGGEDAEEVKLQAFGRRQQTNQFRNERTCLRHGAGRPARSAPPDHKLSTCQRSPSDAGSRTATAADVDTTETTTAATRRRWLDRLQPSDLYCTADWAINLPETLTGVVYLQFLYEELPLLLEDIMLAVRCRIIFQHDGAPPHFLERRRGGGGFHPWPPRSLDLSPLDYCTREELLARIMNAATEINDSRVQLRRATRAGHKRLFAPQARSYQLSGRSQLREGEGGSSNYHRSSTQRDADISTEKGMGKLKYCGRCEGERGGFEVRAQPAGVRRGTHDRAHHRERERESERDKKTKKESGPAAPSLRTNQTPLVRGYSFAGQTPDALVPQWLQRTFSETRYDRYAVPGHGVDSGGGGIPCKYIVNRISGKLEVTIRMAMDYTIRSGHRNVLFSQDIVVHSGRRVARHDEEYKSSLIQKCCSDDKIGRAYDDLSCISLAVGRRVVSKASNITKTNTIAMIYLKKVYLEVCKTFEGNRTKLIKYDHTTKIIRTPLAARRALMYVPLQPSSPPCLGASNGEKNKLGGTANRVVILPRKAVTHKGNDFIDLKRSESSMEYSAFVLVTPECTKTRSLKRCPPAHGQPFSTAVQTTHNPLARIGPPMLVVEEGFYLTDTQRAFPLHCACLPAEQILQCRLVSLSVDMDREVEVCACGTAVYVLLVAKTRQSGVRSLHADVALYRWEEGSARIGSARLEKPPTLCRRCFHCASLHTPNKGFPAGIFHVHAQLPGGSPPAVLHASHPAVFARGASYVASPAMQLHPPIDHRVAENTEARQPLILRTTTRTRQQNDVTDQRPTQRGIFLSIPARSGDGAVVTRTSVTLIAPTLLGKKKDKRCRQAGLNESTPDKAHIGNFRYVSCGKSGPGANGNRTRIALRAGRLVIEETSRRQRQGIDANTTGKTLPGVLMGFAREVALPQTLQPIISVNKRYFTKKRELFRQTSTAVESQNMCVWVPHERHLERRRSEGPIFLRAAQSETGVSALRAVTVARLMTLHGRSVIAADP